MDEKDILLTQTLQKKIAHLEEQLSLNVAEAHHRVKNTLQSVTSLLRILSHKKKSLEMTDVEKLVGYIHNLSAVHTILRDEVIFNQQQALVPLDTLVTRIIELSSAAGEDRIMIAEELPRCYVTARRAASLCLILNEMLSTLFEWGAQKVTIELCINEKLAHVHALISSVQFPDDFINGTSTHHHFQLVRSLCHSDFGFDPILRNLSPTSSAMEIISPINIKEESGRLF